MSKALRKHDYLLKIKFCLLVGLLVFWSGVSLAQTNIWDGSSSNNWNTAANWSLNLVPTSAHDVIFESDAAIAVNVTATINSLTIRNNSTVTFTSSGGAVIITIDNINSAIQSGSTLRLQGSTGSGTRSMSILFSGSGRTMDISGTLDLSAIGEGTIFNATNSLTTVSGTIKRTGGTGTVGVVTSTAANLSFLASSNYSHEVNGSLIPAATWASTSTVTISGTTFTDPSGLNQSFGNFIWNATGLGTNSVNFNPTGIAGNLEINNGIATGQIIQTTTTLSIGGNLTVTGGLYTIATGTSRTLNVAGNISVTGGTLLMSSGVGIGTLNTPGNFSHTAGIINESSTGSGRIFFNGTGTPQIFTSGGTVSNTINWTVNSGAFLQMAEATTIVAGAGTFTLSSGATLGIKSTAGITNTGTTGNIQVTGTRTYTAGSSLVYNGTADQAAGNGLNSTNKANLTIDNPGFTVTIGASTTLTGDLTVIAGSTLDLSTHTCNRSSAGGTLSLEAGSTLIIGGTNSFPINYSTNTLNSTSTVEYNGSTQTVGAVTYGDLIISNSGQKTAGTTATLTVAGNLTVNVNSTLYLTNFSPALDLTGNVTVSGTVTSPGAGKTIGGDFTINSGGFWTEEASPIYSIAGNFSNSGTFNSGTATYNFNGSSLQTIEGSNASSFANLQLSNSNGLLLNNIDAAVTGTLTFTNGKITTGTNKIIVGSAGNAGSISGADADSYVYGNLRRYVPNTLAPTVGYAIGDATNYTPVSITFVGTVTGSGYLDAYTTVSGTPPPFNSGLSQTKYVNRTWTVTNTGVTGFTSHSPSFTYVSGDLTGTPTVTNFAIRKLDGAAWLPVTTAGTPTGINTTGSAVASFGTFHIGENDCSDSNYLWLGGFNSDWNETQNWCGQAVPTALSNVLIPSGQAFDPVIGSANGSSNGLTINTGASLTISGSDSLFVYGNWTNNGSFIPVNSTVSFTGSSQQTLGGANTTSFHNLTINNPAGVKAGANIQVNTTLHLAQADPNTQDGLLDMVKNYGNYSNISTPTENLTFTNTQAHDILDSWILEMGSSSITTGSGGVTGKIKRIDFINNQEYSFGSQNLTMTFATNGSGELPDEILVIMTKGLDKGIHANKTNTVARLFQVIRTGGTIPTTFSIKLNYQDTELNGNTENTLVLWDHHIPYVSSNTPHEHGKSTQDTDQNWVFLTNHGIRYLQTGEELGGATKYWMLSNTLFDANTWLGSVNTDWDVVANWTSGRVPLPTDNVIINDTIIAPRSPVIPATGASAKSVNIVSNAVLDGGAGLLTIYGGLKDNGGIGSWINNGTFLPGTGTVAFNYPRTTLIENATVAGNTEFNNLSILASTFFTPQLNSALKIKGTLTNLGTIDATSFTNTFWFNGDAAQTILKPNGPTPGFYNLTLSGTGDKNFPASLDIIGDFVNNTTTGLVNFNEKTITFNGTNSQTISGSRPTSFHKLVLDNSSGILLENDLTITDTLAFFDGLVDTGTFKQIIGEAGFPGVITGADSTSYINGTLRRYLPNSVSPSIDFPIGDASEYTPVNLSFSGTTTGSGYLEASSIASPPAAGDLPAGSGLNPDNYVNRRWILTNSAVAGFTTYDAVLNYSSNDLVGSANPNFLEVRQLIGSTWSAPSVGTLTSTSIEALGLSGFGQFAAGQTCSEGEWLGLVSTDWNDAANWCGGELPTSSTDVVIKSSATFQPVIGLSGGGVTRNLSIEGGATLTVTGGYTLIVNGTWTNDGTFNPGTSSTVNFASSSDISIEEGPFNNLIFSGTGSKTLPVTPLADGSILVQTAVILSSSVTLEIQADQVLTIESSGSVSTLGLAKLILEPGAIYSNLSTSNPTLEVQQLLQGVKGWRMIGSPVATTYTDFTDSLETQGFVGSTNPTLQPNLLWWDETDKGTSLQGWRQPSNITGNVPLGRGHYLYVFNGDTKPSPALGNYSDNLPVTVTTLGAETNLASFDFDFGITFTGRDTSLVSQGDSLIEVNIADEGFNLIANPTASILDFYAGSGWNKTNLDNTIYVWDPASSQFLTWNGTTGTLGHGRIAPYQAFWIRSNAPSPLLELSGNGAKNILSTDFYGRKLEEKPFTVNLNLNGEGMNAETFISFGEDGKEGADPKDAYQLESLAEDWLLLYSYGSIRTKSSLVINHLPSLDEQEKVIPLYLAASKKGATFNGSYMMDWKLPENWPSTVSIVLMDHISKKAIDMQKESFYPFTFQAPELPNPEARKVATGMQTPRAVVFQSPYEPADQKARMDGTSAAPQRPFTIYIGAFPDNEITYLPDFPTLFAPVPNPFRDQTTIRFYLPVAEKATIQIFDLLGKPVGSFPAKNYEAGIHQLEWIPAAIDLPAGLYIIQLATENYRFTQKLIKN